MASCTDEADLVALTCAQAVAPAVIRRAAARRRGPGGGIPAWVADAGQDTPSRPSAVIAQRPDHWRLGENGRRVPRFCLRIGFGDSVQWSAMAFVGTYIDARISMKLFDLEQRKGLPYITGLYGLGSYAAAYWSAAKGMINAKLFDARGRPDFSTFPIAFLYRHALELMLKAILIEHHEKYSTNPNGLLKRGHRLTNEYLKDLRYVVDNAGSLATGESVVHITPKQWSDLQNVLDEWQQHDPDGMAFRYSIDKRAKKALKNQTFTFDIERFSQLMEEALEILAGLKDELDRLRYQDVLRSERL